jgi:hypothetical protein
MWVCVHVFELDNAPACLVVLTCCLLLLLLLLLLCCVCCCWCCYCSVACDGVRGCAEDLILQALAGRPVAEVLTHAATALLLLGKMKDAAVGLDYLGVLYSYGDVPGLGNMQLLDLHVHWVMQALTQGAAGGNRAQACSKAQQQLARLVAARVELQVCGWQCCNRVE